MTQIWFWDGDALVIEGLLHRLEREGYEAMRGWFPVPQNSGWEGSQVPVLMMRPGPGVMEEIENPDLKAGNGTSPGSVAELYARARSDLYHPWAERRLVPSVSFGQVEVDFERWIARVEGRQVQLSRKAFEVLRVLASRRGCVVMREALLDEVWGYRVLKHRTRVVDMAIGELRERLEPNTLRGHIVTVRGVGYRLERSPDGT